MRNNAPFDTVAFWEMPLIAIMRGFSLETVEPVVEAVGKGGLRALEITMNTEGAEAQIKRAIEVSKGTDMQIGAGTVTSIERFEMAVTAGASFIVTPNLNAQVIQCCRESEIPFIPGTFTPTEIFRAHEVGALAAKIFPADGLGASFIKAIKAPLPQIRVAPTGGVTVDLMRTYLQAGANAFGLGSPLFPRAAIEARDWKVIEASAQSFQKAFTQFAQQKESKP